MFNLVWFKRDLRVDDHTALAAAIDQQPPQDQGGGPQLRQHVLALMLIERRIWREETVAAQHYHFFLESCEVLRESLLKLGIPHLMLDCEDAVQALEQIRCTLGPFRLFSHMETGDEPGYARDRRVAQWCRHQGIVWNEYRQFGVVRGLRERKGWASQWERLMQEPCRNPPDAALPGPDGLQLGGSAWQSLAQSKGRMISIGTAPRASELGLDAHDPPLRQRGGLTLAEATLKDFLELRSQHYRGGISSPLHAEEACSRLSAYLAFGCLSMRRVVQATREKVQELAARRSKGEESSPYDRAAARQLSGLRSFLERLHWHCHFIQKLETEPTIAWKNMHRGYDGLREFQFNPLHFEALRTGRSGWPLVDASVRMLDATGWINFRMRAMLVSVAAYPLWLHWREVGKWLASRFLDYEPGIHWSQMQMQSGTTGINAMRVYNPIKQAQDQDPEGVFVRRWLEHMRELPRAWLLEPWLAPPELRRRLGIPEPLVDLAHATRLAKARIHTLRCNPEVIREAAELVRRHASTRPERRPVHLAEPRSAGETSRVTSAVDTGAGLRTSRNRDDFQLSLDL